MKTLFLFMAMLWSSLSYASPSWVTAPDDAGWLAHH